MGTVYLATAVVVCLRSLVVVVVVVVVVARCSAAQAISSAKQTERTLISCAPSIVILYIRSGRVISYYDDVWLCLWWCCVSVLCFVVLLLDRSVSVCVCVSLPSCSCVALRCVVCCVVLCCESCVVCCRCVALSLSVVSFCLSLLCCVCVCCVCVVCVCCVCVGASSASSSSFLWEPAKLRSVVA